MTTLAQVNEDFDRLFGEQLAATTPPIAPEPMRKPEPTIPAWPPTGGHEL